MANKSKIYAEAFNSAALSNQIEMIATMSKEELHALSSPVTHALKQGLHAEDKALRDQARRTFEARSSDVSRTTFLAIYRENRRSARASATNPYKPPEPGND